MTFDQLHALKCYIEAVAETQAAEALNEGRKVGWLRDRQQIFEGALDALWLDYSNGEPPCPTSKA